MAKQHLISVQNLPNWKVISQRIGFYIEVFEGLAELTVIFPSKERRPSLKGSNIFARCELKQFRALDHKSVLPII